MRPLVGVLLIGLSLYTAGVFAGGRESSQKCGFNFPEASCFQCDKSYLRSSAKVKERKLQIFKHLSETRYAKYGIVDSKYAEESFRYGGDELRLECFEGGALRLVKTMKAQLLPSGELDTRVDVAKFWIGEAIKLFRLGSEITTLRDGFSDGMRSAEQALKAPLGFTKGARGFYASRNTEFVLTPLDGGRVDLEVRLEHVENGGE